MAKLKLDHVENSRLKTWAGRCQCCAINCKGINMGSYRRVAQCFELLIRIADETVTRGRRGGRVPCRRTQGPLGDDRRLFQHRDSHGDGLEEECRESLPRRDRIPGYLTLHNEPDVTMALPRLLAQNVGAVAQDHSVAPGLFHAGREGRSSNAWNLRNPGLRGSVAVSGETKSQTCSSGGLVSASCALVDW